MPLKPPQVAAPVANPDPRDRASLLAALESADAGERRAGARALAGDPEAVPALCARLGHEADVAVWDAILTSLAQTGSDAALRGLLAYLRADPAQLRNEVLEALKTFPEAEIEPHIEALLADPDPHVRIAVIHLVEALGLPAGLRLLTMVLERESQVNVAATAVDLLAEVGTPAAVPTLQRAQARFAQVPFMRFAIETTLARIRDGDDGSGSGSGSDPE